MLENKLLILILSTNDKSYDKFKNSIFETWINNAKKKKVNCIFYEGGSKYDRLDNNVLKLACDDSTQKSGLKLYNALKFIEKSSIEYTHIYRTNLSSFLFIDDLMEFNKNLPNTVYAGHKTHYFKFKLLNKFPNCIQNFLIKIPFLAIFFASGSGFFLSKDLVNKIIKTKKIKFNILDDVMIGNILKNQIIKDIPRYDIIDSSNSIKNINSFHVRIKTSNRANDAMLMYELNKFKHLNEYLQSKINID